MNRIIILIKKNDKKLNVNCRNSACSHNNDKCEAYVELGEYFVFNSKIYKYYNKSKVVSGENRLYGSIVEEESGKTVFKNSIPTDMSSELAIDDSEAILYVRVLSDDIIKVDGDRHAYLLDKNFNIIYCHYNIGKFPWGAILNGNYYYINDINEIVKVNLTTFESKSIASMVRLLWRITMRILYIIQMNLANYISCHRMMKVL